MLAVAFLLGEPLSTLYVTVGWDRLSSWPQATGLTVGALFLIAGGVLLSMWFMSATRATLSVPGPIPPWACPVLVTAAIVAVVPWFAAWFGSHMTNAWTPVPGQLPDTGIEIGWYDTLVRWTGLNWLPLWRLFLHPLTLPGLVLLWLTPVLITARRRGTGTTNMPHPLRLALKAGLAGGCGAITGSIVLVFVARSVLPATVRHNPEGIVRFGTTPFTSVHDLVYVAVAVLAQVLVAAVVAARATRHRPILTLLATGVTGTLATIGLFLVTITVSRCADLFGGKRPDMSVFSPRCFVMHTPHYIAQHAHWIIVKGAVAAVPAALLGAGIGALYRR